MSERKYPPPYMDLHTLAEHICTAERTIEMWVKQGIFPAPRKQGGRNLWSWKAVEKHLAGDQKPGDNSQVTEMEQIRNATRSALRDH
jgi:hypothetical protein